VTTHIEKMDAHEICHIVPDPYLKFEPLIFFFEREECLVIVLMTWPNISNILGRVGNVEIWFKCINSAIMG
jgi:hypothetical protein